MREFIYNSWNSVMNAKHNPLRHIPDDNVRHLIMQLLAWMWGIAFSLWVGSMWVFGVTAIAHIVILAAIIMFPYLVIISDIFGITGGLVASTYAYEPLTVTMFFQGLEIYGHIETDSLVGLVKGLFFGFSITSIACYKGYYAKGCLLYTSPSPRDS